MPRFFITGSSDGLGLLTAQRLLAHGHSVVLHARSPTRADETRAKCPEAEAILVGDLTSLDETKALAAEANKLGPYDAVLHNAGVYSGVPAVFARPRRLLFVSSQMHYAGRDLDGDGLERSGYSDSKLHDVMLAKVFARRWKDVGSFSADPGSAPESIEDAVDTFVHGSADTGAYFKKSRVEVPSSLAQDEGLQDKLVQELERISGVKIPVQ
ncbi:hypothetical protein B0H14DRAFT_2663067 [Mycena olivaceomarginata]|nr:hypothetical protein B0H14DRAFT_2663067 [Mycena olivaceomarginata]